MGWLYCPDWTTRKELINHLVEGNGVKTLAHCCRGNVLWAVQENSSGTRFIMCYLMQSGGWEGWGYKDIDESMSPNYYTCPLSYLELVPEAPNEWARKWRGDVLVYHAARAMK